MPSSPTINLTLKSSKIKANEEALYEGVLTKATKHVNDYYTPHSLKRVLQYVAIDYIMLNLTVPSWAHDMLKKDNDDGGYDSIFSEAHS